MYIIYLFFLDVKATIDTRESTLIEAMHHVIKRQNWNKDDLIIFRDRIVQLQNWIEQILDERY